MKIALISDIHDQVENLAWAKEEMRKHSIDFIFALGDYCTPYIIERLGIIGPPIIAVWGNNDGDKVAMMQAVEKDPQNKIQFQRGQFAEIELGGEKYFLTHYPLLAENAALSRKYKAVFHGHTHQQRNDEYNGTPLINPGKLAVYPAGPVSWALYDTEEKTVEFINKPIK